MMRIWLRAQEDMATRTELLALVLDTLQGRAGSLGTVVTSDTMWHKVRDFFLLYE